MALTITAKRVRVPGDRAPPSNIVGHGRGNVGGSALRTRAERAFKAYVQSAKRRESDVCMPRVSSMIRGKEPFRPSDDRRRAKPHSEQKVQTGVLSRPINDLTLG